MPGKNISQGLSLLENERGILVGYSGGADSSALLHLLHGFCKKSGKYLRAIHDHHGIRGDEADRDAAFCIHECERLGVDASIEYADVPALAKQSGRGLEETARACRYAAFSRILSSDGRLSCVVTAHNADDNAETVVFHLARGCGIDGLCGIDPVCVQNGIRVIRPLLSVTKREILGYCKENRIEYRFDSTNNDTAYTRNFIRHELMPKFQQINPSCLTAMQRMTETLRSDAELLDRLAAEFVEANVTEDGICTEALAAAPKPIASRAVMRLYSEIGSHTPERVHIDAVLALVKEAKNGSSVSLPGGIRAVIRRGKLSFTDAPTEIPEPFRFELHEGVNRFDGCDFAIIITRKGENSQNHEKDKECLKNIYKLSIHTQVNSDKINHVLYIRQRVDGDSYIFGGMTRRLKKLFNDRGIAPEVRAGLPIVCDSEGIVWVPGFAAADRVRGEGLSIIYYYNHTEVEQ